MGEGRSEMKIEPVGWTGCHTHFHQTRGGDIWGQGGGRALGDTLSVAST